MEETIKVMFFEIDRSTKSPDFQEVGKHLCSATMSYSAATTLPMIRSAGVGYILAKEYYFDIDTHILVRFAKRIDGTFPIIGVSKVNLSA